MKKNKRILIIGDSSFAQVAYEYFRYDSEYDVVCFSVERGYLKNDSLCGLPVLPFEDIETYYPPCDTFFYAALVYTQLNRLRTRLYKAAKAKGFKPASYISRKSFIWRNVKFGEHVFIFEDNTIQPFVEIGSNVVLWSGNHIGHHSVVKDNNFISSHVVISGHTVVGENCFLGVNATIGNNLTIGDDCVIGAGALITKDVPPGKLLAGTQTKVPEENAAKQYFKVSDEEIDICNG